MKKLSMPILNLTFGAMLLLSGCSFGPQAAENAEAAQVEPSPTPIPSVPVEVSQVENGDISLVFAYPGTVRPKDEATINPGAAGQIEAVLVEEGDLVAAGDPIAIIEDDVYQTQIKQAEAALTTARINLAKMQLGSRPEEIAAAQAAVELAKAALNDVSTINDNERTQAAAALAHAQSALRGAQTEYDKIAWAGDVGSKPEALALEEATIGYESALAAYNTQTNPSDAQLAPLMLQLAQAQLNLALKLEPFRQVDFATAEAGIQQAEAALELVQLQLAETVIEAPFDGIIDQLNIIEGSRVSQQSAIATIISEELDVVVDVQEKLITQVQKDQIAAMKMSAYPDKDFPGVVTSIAPKADANTRTFRVKVTPTQDADLLRGGMFADVSILAQENKNSVLAPRLAITFDGNNPTAYVVKDDNTVELRTVTTGLQNNTHIEILSGLKPGELVVTIGQPNLIDGAHVDVANDPRIAE